MHGHDAVEPAVPRAHILPAWPGIPGPFPAATVTLEEYF